MLKKIDLIINFTKNVWHAHFPEYYYEAPLTLAYDPLCKIPDISGGLCHIAHSYDWINPDKRIISIEERDHHFFNSSDDMSQKIDLEKLPALDCILFISGESGQNVDFILKKLNPNGVSIVLDKCIDLSFWPTVHIQTNLEELKNSQWIQAYYKP